jgi:hypothetical protein
VELDSKSEGAFEMEPDLDLDSDSDAGLGNLTESIYISDEGFDNSVLEEGDWFSGVEDYLDESDELDSIFTAETNANELPIRAEVYNSGCTQHITPYRDDLTNFTNIPPSAIPCRQ